jgi:hypothetical protein
MIKGVCCCCCCGGGGGGGGGGSGTIVVIKGSTNGKTLTFRFQHNKIVELVILFYR